MPPLTTQNAKRSKYPFFPHFVRILKFFIREYKGNLSVILLLSLITSAATLIDPFLTRYIIDDIILAKQTNMLSTLLGILVVIAFSLFGLNFLLQLLLVSTAEKFSINLKVELLKTVFHFPLKFFNQKNSGEIIYNLFYDSETIHEGVVDSITMLVINLFTAFFAFIAMIYMSIPLAICILVGTLIQILIIYTLSNPIARVSKEQKQQHEEVLGVISDSISDIPIYKNTTTEMKLLNLVQQSLFKLRKKIIRAFIYFKFSSNTCNLVENLTQFAILWLGAWLVFQNHITTGTLLAFISLQALFGSPLLNIIQFLINFPSTAVSVQRYSDIMKQETEFSIPRGIWPDSKSQHEFKENNDNSRLNEKSWELKVEDLSFSYPNTNQQIFKNLNLTVSKGEKVAIFGDSGSGKSTLVDILLGYYHADQGNIYLNDISTKFIHPHTLRRNCFILPQEDTLISSSIESNITLGVEDEKSHNKIYHALKQTFPRRKKEDIPLKATISNQISNFSFGEKKRFALSRLFLSKPKLILFDELTAGLDAETTKIIINNISQMFPETPTIFLTHSNRILPFVQSCYKIENQTLKLFSPSK